MPVVFVVPRVGGLVLEFLLFLTRPVIFRPNRSYRKALGMDPNG